VLGTDAGPPQNLTSQLTLLRVSWNGTAVPLRPALYADCFNADPAGLRVLPAEDLGAVLISISGGDGAGAYTVYWSVSRDGAAVRFAAGEGEF
jgi:hypothetical protein